MGSTTSAGERNTRNMSSMSCEWPPPERHRQVAVLTAAVTRVRLRGRVAERKDGFSPFLNIAQVVKKSGESIGASLCK
jgi:hypothetical protein